MKLVKENLFEKFSENSDPIHDMGIGGIRLARISKKLKDEYKKNYMKTFKDLLEGKTISGKFNEVMSHFVRTDSDTNDIKSGRGWGNYTIHVDEILNKSFDDDSLTILVYDEKKKSSYLVPIDDSKIFLQE